jgi:hypothetical protein
MKRPAELPDFGPSWDAKIVDLETAYWISKLRADRVLVGSELGNIVVTKTQLSKALIRLKAEGIKSISVVKMPKFTTYFFYRPSKDEP